jgi:predicted DNA-binding transcriptional regulator AlpA
MKPEPLLTTSEVATWLQKPPMTLAIWRSKKIGPRFLKLENGSVRYERSAVDEWLATCRTQAG